MNASVRPLRVDRKMRLFALSLIMAALRPDLALACECSEKVWNELRAAPEKARIAALVRRRASDTSSTSPGAKPPSAPTKGRPSGGSKSEAVVPLEVIPLNATPLASCRVSGSSCDVEIVDGSRWWLLLSQNEPNDVLKSCRTLVYPIERAGELIDRLAQQIPSSPLPNPAWLICNASSDCASSPESGCIGRLSVNRRHLDLVQQWRKKVEPMISCPSPAVRRAQAQSPSGPVTPSSGEVMGGEPRCVNQLCQ